MPPLRAMGVAPAGLCRRPSRHGISLTVTKSGCRFITAWCALVFVRAQLSPCRRGGTCFPAEHSCNQVKNARFPTERDKDGGTH